MSELSIQDLNGGTSPNVDNTITSILSPEPAADSPVDSEQSQPAATEQTPSQNQSATNSGQQSVAETTQAPPNNDQPNDTGNPELESAVARLRSLIVPAHQIAPWLRVHIYGRPGSGKTVFGADNKLRTLFVDIEEGALSLLNHPEIAANCEVIPFQSFRQLQVLIEVLQQGAFPEFKVVMFDTWSELSKDETDKAYEANKNNPRAGRIHPDLAAGMDYQVSNEHMRRLAVACRGLDRHVIFVSHMKEEKNSKTGDVIRIRPNISPGLLSTMDAFVSVTGYMNAEWRGTQGMVRTFQPWPDAIVDAKTRLGGLPRPHLTNASFADILHANAEMRKVNQ